MWSAFEKRFVSGHRFSDAVKSLVFSARLKAVP